MTNTVTLATALRPDVGNSVIVVTATYTYSLPASITFTPIAFARPRGGSTVTHS